MGYDLHIHRAEDWTQAEDRPITLVEWSQYVGSNPDFRMDNFAEAETTSGERIRIENEGLAVWTGCPSEDTAWFDHQEGRIVVKNPDEAMRRKMFAIAEVFEARVQGDEGEFYGSDGEPEGPVPSSSPPARPSRFRRLFGGN